MRAIASDTPHFSFTESDHSYWLEGVRIPSITQLIQKGGLVSGEHFFTEASRARGTEIHTLCTAFDLGALVQANLEGPHSGYVLAYLAASAQMKPEWTRIEEADYHAGLKFAGRIDREGIVLRQFSIVELKSAVKAAHHAVQTALQTILTEPRHKLPLTTVQRLCIYLKANGKFQVVRHEDARDFDEAFRLIKEFC